MKKRPLVIAHRGASKAAPENTMAAFEQAVAMKSDMIELDTQRTKDGHFVVIHDRTLQRTTNGKGRVADHTLDELRTLDAGSWFDESFAGEPIPTLADVLKAMKSRCAVNIEIKNLPYPDEGVEQALVDLLEEVNFPTEDIIVSSFDHLCLKRLSDIAPSLATAMLFGHVPSSLSGLDTKTLHPHWQVIRPEFVEWVRETGQKVNVYTVDSPKRWEKLIEVGIDGIITNCPDELNAYLEENGLAS